MKLTSRVAWLALAVVGRAKDLELVKKRLQHVTCVTCVNVPKVHQLIRVLAVDKA